jgi:hypothetical protein
MAINSLRPLLIAAEESGDAAAWWFIRKGESRRQCVLPADSRDASAVLGRLTSTLTERAAVRHAEGQQARTEAFGAEPQRSVNRGSQLVGRRRTGVRADAGRGAVPHATAESCGV